MSEQDVLLATYVVHFRIEHNLIIHLNIPMSTFKLPSCPPLMFSCSVLELTGLVLFVGLFNLRLFGFVCFLFLLVSGKGCGLWLWHSLDFSLSFLAHLSRRLKASYFDHQPSVVVLRLSVRPFTIFKQHLLLNHLLEFDQTSQELSLVGPLPKFFKWFRFIAYLGHRS